MLALIDIDGTIADCSHRLGHIRGGEVPDWEAFFDAMDKDTPIRHICDLVRVLGDGYNIIYLTGRPDSHRVQTAWWLDCNFLAKGKDLLMRKAGDHRPDYIVKKELYEKFVFPIYGKPNLVIEDRKQVVDMWRGMGITVLQPKDGDY